MVRAEGSLQWQNARTETITQRKRGFFTAPWFAFLIICCIKSTSVNPDANSSRTPPRGPYTDARLRGRLSESERSMCSARSSPPRDKMSDHAMNGRSSRSDGVGTGGRNDDARGERGKNGGGRGQTRGTENPIRIECLTESPKPQQR